MTQGRIGQPWTWVLIIAGVLIMVALALILGVAGAPGRGVGGTLLLGTLIVLPASYGFLRNVARDDARRDRYVDPHAISELPPFELPSHEDRLLGWDKKRLGR